MFKPKPRNRNLDSGYPPGESADVPVGEGTRDSSAGGLLRTTREGLGWNIRDVAAALRIRADYLDALERNSVDGLPGPTYATGFLRAYAEYLGLDGHEIVRRFRAEKSGLHNKPELAFPVPLTDRGIPGGGMFLIAILVFALGYGAYYYYSSGTRSTPAEIAPPPARLLPPPPAPPPPIALAEPPKPADTTPAATPAPALPATPPAAAAPAGAAPKPIVTPPASQPAAVATATPAPGATPPAAAPAPTDADGATGHTYGEAKPGRIVVHATGRTWVTVKDGPKPILDRLLTKGDTYYSPDRPGITLRTGNAGALQIEVDGKPVPPLGPIGLVRSVTLSPEALQGGTPPG